MLNFSYIAGFASATDVVLAAPVSWVDWTTFEAGFTDGTAAGTANDGGLTVTYSGEVYNLQTQVDGAGTDWWAPDSTWADGSTIDNAPRALTSLRCGAIQAATTRSHSRGR
jgi:hypothetical protein